MNWRDPARRRLLSPHRYESALDVFHADFTVESDKHLLVDVVLGLYALARIMCASTCMCMCMCTACARHAWRGPQTTLDCVAH